MECYVIGFSSNVGVAPSAYWDGFDKTENIAQAFIYKDVNEARGLKGRLQSSFSQEEVLLVPVNFSVVAQ